MEHSSNPGERTNPEKGVYWRNKDGTFTFFDGNEPISLREWNERLNETHPMRRLEEHPNPLIRVMEIRRRRKLLKLVGPGLHRTIVDVGCEQGHIAAALARPCRRLYCVDIDAQMLQLAKQAVKEAHVTYLCNDVQSIQLETGTADVTLCAEVLEHVPDLDRAMTELLRITKPEGRIVISVPNDPWLLLLKRIIRWARLGRLIGGLSSGLAPGHLRRFNRRRLRALGRRYARVRHVSYDWPFCLHTYMVLRPH